MVVMTTSKEIDPRCVVSEFKIGTNSIGRRIRPLKGLGVQEHMGRSHRLNDRSILTAIVDIIEND